MKVLQFPLARITIGFLAGILVGYYFKPDVAFAFSTLFIATCVFVFTYFWSKRNAILTLYYGLATYFLAFSIGTSTQIIHTDSYQESNYIHQKTIFEKPHLVSVTIREKLRSSAYNDRYIVLVKKIDDSVNTGRMLLNIRKDSLNHPFEIGTSLQIDTNLYQNRPSKNPNQFDYGKYLEGKQIYAQLYADVSNIKIGSFIEKDVWYYTSKLRTKIIRNLEETHFNKTELNVAIALILGQQQDISPEIIRDYQFAGAVHILSVSGLHIGFILLFVTLLLKPFPNTRRGSFIKLIIILLSLFSFGLIAGLAPSVLRSVTMFSFVAIGMYLRRSTNIFHTLLVSMLLILLVQPSFLFDVGFQLSYVALFFILWLQPLLAQLWKPKNTIINYFWEILTVSFAAQIGTLPLSIYYFHQFPGLFFVTNLVIIPFLSVIMALGVLVMVLAALDFVPVFLAKSLEWSIYILNKIINSIASLEQFIFRDISFNWQLLLSLYLLIIATIIWFKKPNFNRLAFVLITVIIFQITYFQTHWTIRNQSELIIFNSKKNTLIAERNGANITLYACDSLLEIANKNQTFTSYLMGNFSNLKTKKRIQNLIYFKGKKILILDSLGVYPTAIRPDIVVFTQSPKINLERFLQTSKPKMVIADASNYRNIQKLWKATCLKEKIPFHATGEKGFYSLE
ncbi:ComEC family competence protein [Flavobacterium franklandianum]|uniref:ComEC family competence protein n=2 Tax=Flavobacterium franklandianum TaxID=2594430 RepID=A0A553CKL7_9FLAO|nr:ComEC/Rec2 family competence protein [Flavobacterium franklandianum]TRX21063.1 ComEC family competence protein [Flavobacterium franklandianum]TRX29107.1 ComEC family competence protein [Flavobacterium franklandianum]